MEPYKLDGAAHLQEAIAAIRATTPKPAPDTGVAEIVFGVIAFAIGTLVFVAVVLWAWRTVF